MVKTLLKRTAMASLFILMTLTVTKANTKETFIYGETDNGMIVSTLNEDGKTLTPKWKYEYQYDEQGQLSEKKAYRWNLYQQAWIPAYLLTITSSDSICIMDYAEWDKLFCNFERNRQQSVYYTDYTNSLLTYCSRSFICDTSENNK
ncbi:DUF3836 domain-containing protein [Phocaeicola sp. HCN-6420]|jgi:YD repeat-containing protein|uniref:DUF3836 domain-containing protein n=1 Tax=Phocaeicola sp. HCN-6420 TaxID=3134673 RepID=UPI0030BCC75F